MNNTGAAKVPECYGHLHNPRDEQCMACLLNPQCKQAMSKPKTAVGTALGQVDIPTDKKSMILLVCHKYGIPATYSSKKFECDIEITEENKEEFHNLDFLLTNKFALTRLLEAPLERD